MKLRQNLKKTYSLQDLPKSGRISLVCDRMHVIKEAIDETYNENQSPSIKKVYRSTGVPSDCVGNHTSCQCYRNKIRVIIS